MDQRSAKEKASDLIYEAIGLLGQYANGQDSKLVAEYASDLSAIAEGIFYLR